MAEFVLTLSVLLIKYNVISVYILMSDLPEAPTDLTVLVILVLLMVTLAVVCFCTAFLQYKSSHKGRWNHKSQYLYNFMDAMILTTPHISKINDAFLFV